MPQSAIVVSKDATTTIDLFLVHLPERKITSSSPSVFMAVASFFLISGLAELTVMTSRFKNTVHWRLRIIAPSDCVSHEAHINVLMVNLSDMFWRGEQ